LERSVTVNGKDKLNVHDVRGNSYKTTNRKGVTLMLNGMDWVQRERKSTGRRGKEGTKREGK
jgi:hypothetical protein